MKHFFGLFLISLFFVWFSFAGRCCCSRHGGQSYCGSNWMRQCNDGTQSPTCTCYVAPKVVKKAVVKAKPIAVVKAKPVVKATVKAKTTVTPAKKLTCKVGYVVSSTGKSCVKKK